MVRPFLVVTFALCQAAAASRQLTRSGAPGAQARAGEGSSEVFDGGFISDAGQGTNLAGDTAFVLKTWGSFSPFKVQQLKKYAEQLSGAGIPVMVLRDATTMLQDDRDGKTRNRFLTLDDGSSVPLCDVSWPAALEEWGREPFLDLKPHGGGDLLDVGQGVHNQYEALWWKHCRPSDDIKYVWFAEDDAVFDGNVAQFVSRYRDADADLISSSFRIAGPNWWNFASFNSSLNRGLKLFDSTAPDVVMNVSPLPSLKMNPCADGSEDHNGLVFREDMVERYSSRLFGMLEHALEKQVIAPAEAFMSTLCATGLGLGDGERCSMLDWAPVQDRDSGNTWASPLWCWGGALDKDGFQQDWQDHCSSERWTNKWIHPVKEQQAKLLKCQDNTTS